MDASSRLGHSLSIWTFLFVVAANVFGLPNPSFAQRPTLPMVAFVGLDSGNSLRLGAFREGLRKLGYEEGVNVQLEVPNLEDRYDRLRDAVAELVRLKVKVIVT
jgi:hypothetical protein